MDKQKVKLILLVLISLALLSIVVFQRAQNPKKSNAFFIMDTFFEVTTTDKKVDPAFMKDLENHINQIDAKLNTYNPTSEISQINQNAGIKEVRVSEETFNVLRTAVLFTEMSDGLFSITFQPLQDLYGFQTSEFRVPSKSEIENVLPLLNVKKIQLNEDTKTVFIQDKRIKINLSGLLKGYVLDQVKSYMDSSSIKTYFLNFGGNLYIKGDKPEKIGIKNPRSDGVIYSFPLQDGFVSTSADYQQFFERGNLRYTHIVNPLTGSAVQKMQTVTVVANSGIMSDFLSTTLFLMDPKDIEPLLLKNHQSVFFYAYDGTKEYKNQRLSK